MQRRAWKLRFTLAIASLACCDAPAAAQSLKVPFAALSPNYAPLWIADQAGFFKKYGLDVQLIYISAGSVIVPAILSGQVDIANMSSAPALIAWARGAELSAVGVTSNRLLHVIMTRASIKRPEELKNKKIGGDRYGSLSDLILRNTDTTAMQSDAFVATERHSGTLGGVDPTGQEAADGMAQLVVGSPGEDTLTGGGLEDTLVAARGHMTMTGGDGADTFVFNVDNLKGKHNTTTITDFDPKVDKLQFSYNAHVEKSSDHHGGTLLQVGGETIDLLRLKPNEVHPHDWMI